MKKIIIIMSSILSVTILVIIYVYSNPFLKIKLNGNSHDVIEVNSNYIDLKAKANILRKDISNNITVSSDLNMSKLGSYKITYKVNYFGSEKTIDRYVDVVDTTKPIISLNGAEVVYINVGDKYNDAGVIVNDNYDKINDIDISSNFDNQKAGEYEIKYSVVDSSHNSNSIKRKIIVVDTALVNNNIEPTYIKGILIVNKKYGLPENYGNGIDKEALNHLHQLQSDALSIGLSIPTLSAYRSYNTQKILYDNYYNIDGDIANFYSAKPGHSEHQTGLAFDVGDVSDNFGDTIEGKWLKENCAKYGFIVRYPKGKENITGYKYEPWHVRYLGIDIATFIMKNNITLEEYLEVE